jgi:hypothetical protein
MAEMNQSVPQFQYPDLLGSYVRGQMAPGELQAQQQQLTAGNLNIDQLRLAVGSQQMGQDVVRGALQSQGLIPGGPSAGMQMGAGSQAVPTGGVQNGPQGAVSSPQGSGGPPFSPAIASAMALAQGRDPTAAYTEAQNAQLESRKLQLQAPMNLAHTVATDPNADRTVWNNPSLMAGWKQYAPRLGIDPNNPQSLTPLNSQRAATLWYNDMAGQIGQGGAAMPDPQQTTRLPDGTIIQQSSLSHAITAPYKPELQKTIGPDGQPVLTPPSQAVGQKPFESTVYGADQLSAGAVQTAADFFRTNGKMPEGFSRNPLAAGKVYAQAASDMTASGDTMGAINARSAALGANKEALEQVTKLQTATVGYANTLDKNLTSLLALQGKTDTSGVPLLNKAYRAWQQGVSGDPDVAQAVTYLSSAQGEFAKLKSGSFGNAPASDAAMADAKDVINKFMANGQITAVAAAMRGEAANRTSAIEGQKQAVLQATGVNAPSANQSPASSQVPARNAQGWVLHKDARGNQAYVSPDAKQFQEVH